jgi:endonuclease/exonuclease/phosphatase family metal-dependent hydrolase
VNRNDVLKIGTLNIQKRNRFPQKGERIQTSLISENWDVLLLQECLLEHDASIIGLEKLRESFPNQVTSVSRKFSNGIWMGNAILSKLPLSHVHSLKFRHARGMSQRSALAACLERDGSRYMLVSLHLGLMEKERKSQISDILSYCHDNASGFEGLVIGGDFNDWSGQCHRSISLWSQKHKSWPALCGPDEITTADLPATYPAAFPLLALDRIYAWGACRVENLSVMPRPLLSDHRALVADVRLA